MDVTKQNSNRLPGFTIVELLVVIVVITILAAITVVGYTSVQSKAKETSIQGDLAAIAKKYDAHKASTGTYPFGYALNMGSIFRISVNKDSYDLTKNYQLLNCTSSANPGSDYAILASSTSGKRYYISSNGSSVKEYTGADSWLNLATCPIILSGSIANGGGYALGSGWRAWINP